MRDRPTQKSCQVSDRGVTTLVEIAGLRYCFVEDGSHHPPFFVSKAQRFLLLEVVFLAGLGLRLAVSIPVEWVWTLVTVTAGTALIRQQFRMMLLAVVAVFLLGVWRAELGIRLDAIQKQEIVPRQAVMTGTVIDDVDRRLEGQRFVFLTEFFGSRQRLLVKANLYPEIHYGDEAQLSCRLYDPNIVGQSYERYLALSDISTVCQASSVQIVGRGQANPMLETLFSFRQRFIERLERVLPEPHTSLLAGLVLGARSGLPEEVLTSFRSTGLSHIIALSGYNITILGTMVFGFCLALGLGRRSAFWIVSLTFVAFVLMTGAAASVVRASMMGFLVLLARRIGRASQAHYALVFVAMAMAFFQPGLLLFDVGFQLSFLATLGLIMLNPWLIDRLTFVPARLGFREAASSTLSANLMTLPLLLYHFGQLSIVAPLANVLVLPLIPFTMLAGLIVGMIPLAGVIAAPVTWALLNTILFVSDTLSHLSWSALEITRFPALAMWLSYGLLAAILFALKRLPRSDTHEQQ